MPMSPAATIAAQIKSDIDAIGIVAGTAVTGAQITQALQAIVQRIYTDLQTNAQVNAGAFAVAAAPGPVTGEGGPLV